MSTQGPYDKSEKKTIEEAQNEGMKIMCLLNPHLYENVETEIHIEMTSRKGEEPLIIHPTVLGLIGFINGALHQLEHHIKKIDS